MVSPAHRARTPNMFSRRQLLAMGVAVAGAFDVVSAQTVSQPASDVSALLQRQTEQLMDAIAAGDRAPWQRYIAENVVFLTEDGVRKTKGDLVNEIRVFPPEIRGRIRVTGYDVVRHDRIAIATYIADEEEGYYGQVLHARYRSTDTWLSTDGAWQMIALRGQRTGRNEEALKVELPDVLFVPGQPRLRKIFKRDPAGHITGFVERRETWDISWRRVS
jgi:hypothetical protein